jgi:signal transduction histidine kinase
MEQLLINLIIVIGWPILITLTALILFKANSFYTKLKGTIIGRLIIPTVIGWLFGMYSLGVVATSYMLGYEWYYTVIPAFLLFLIAIISIVMVIDKWEIEATSLQNFYEDLEIEVKRRTEELEAAHKKQIEHEKEIQKLKDQFVYIAAHELKTPVTAINWALQLVLEKGEDLKPEVLDSLRSVENSNKRLITLVDDLLNVARIEAGTIEVSITKFNVSEVINETIKEMESVFKDKGVEVVYKDNKELNVEADRDRFKQVLINLLSNAAKYNNNEKGKISITHEIKDEKVITNVEDNGIGVKEEDLETLFTKFGRIRTNDTKEIEGTGLGLYLCKKIMENMEGGIWAKSTYGEGSTFSFSVPVA